MFFSSAEYIYEVEIDIGRASVDTKSQRGKLFIQIIGDGTKTDMTELTRG